MAWKFASPNTSSQARLSKVLTHSFILGITVLIQLWVMSRLAGGRVCSNAIVVKWKVFASILSRGAEEVALEWDRYVFV